MRIAAAGALFLAAGVLLAQSILPHELEEGRQLFLANCAACHGPDGNSVPGIDLQRGKFRRRYSDEELVQIIRNGIPETGMPRNDLGKWEAQAVVAFLRSSASTERGTRVTGDAAKGKALFEGKGACPSCHRVGDKGSRVGPDLTDVGAHRPSAELERSLLDPDAEALPENRFVRLITRDGAAITGRLLNRDAFTIQLIDARERLLSLRLCDLKEWTIIKKSLMPSYRGQLSPEEVADVVSYLASLKGITVQ